ncbi:MAG: putative selenium-dependent hydroxylase accessory protein YqeC [Myxococcales bacterium]|nr:putative selenium-dependent hydroxylase accessory protein YqeC [Myxococcales bacterium]
MQVSRAPLVEALGLPPASSLISIVGGGGKSALLFALGRLLPGRVLLTTTTRIFTTQIKRAVAACELGVEGFEEALADGPSGLLVIDRIIGDKAIGVSPSLPAEWLKRHDVQHVVVEADGSRMRPAKAPAEHEPVIADASTHVVVVVGIDALAAPIAQATHRPELVCALLNLEPDACLGIEDLARLIRDDRGGLKDVSEAVRVRVVINKVESEEQQADAAAIARVLLRESRIDRVIWGALEGSKRGADGEWSVARRAAD